MSSANFVFLMFFHLLITSSFNYSFWKTFNFFFVLALIQCYKKIYGMRKKSFVLFFFSFSFAAGVSAGCSLVSLTWAMTVFSDTQRRTRNASCSRHFIRLGLHWGWQLFMTAARIAAFVFFACALEGWMFACMGMNHSWISSVMFIVFFHGEDLQCVNSSIHLALSWIFKFVRWWKILKLSMYFHFLVQKICHVFSFFTHTLVSQEKPTEDFREVAEQWKQIITIRKR